MLLLATGPTLFYWFNRNEVSANEVVSGEVLVDGLAVTHIPDGSRVEIAGDAAAVIRLSDGTRAELAPASELVLRGRVGEVPQVIELERGSGNSWLTSGAGSSAWILLLARSLRPRHRIRRRAAAGGIERRGVDEREPVR